MERQKERAGEPRVEREGRAVGLDRAGAKRQESRRCRGREAQWDWTGRQNGVVAMASLCGSLSGRA